MSAAGCLLQYAKDTQRGALPHIRSISTENRDETVALDASSRRNLSWISTLPAARKTPSSMYSTILRPIWPAAFTPLAKPPLQHLTTLQARQQTIAALQSNYLYETLHELS